MIVKFLRPSAVFKGVGYNLDKEEKGKAELVKAVNFGALQGLENPRKADYLNYLEAWSARSKRIVFPQLHVVISCKGRSHTREELSEIAEQWLQGMGYGKQPYLLAFHKDTANNHLHIVSTRVDHSGKKINDSFEKLRAYQVLNKIMGLDVQQQAESDIGKALAYGFSTRAQLLMILEGLGYRAALKDGRYQISKFGKEVGMIGAVEIDGRITAYQKDIDRLAQLRAVVARYQGKYDPAVFAVTDPVPTGKPNGYTSELSQFLLQKFGVQVLFHGAAEKPPYGYTLIDHSRQMVYKGRDLMPLAEFTGPQEKSQQDVAPVTKGKWETTSVFDPATSPGFDTGRLGKTPEFISGPETPFVPDAGIPLIQLDIAEDIDDEAIHGRNRRRQRKARTNTR